MRRIVDTILSDDYSFERKKGQLSFSCAKLEHEVAPGKTIQGSFTVLAEDKYKPEGYVYSSDLRMLISRSRFGGLENEILYQFDSHGLEEGSVCEGHLSVVSNLGEYEIPYCITVARNLPETTMGEIKNLFHFANLAQESWQEAVALFYSPQFIHILNGSESQYRAAYLGMSAIPGNERNVENFLILVKKKMSQAYHTNTTSIEISAPADMVMQSLIIKREGWGYAELDIYTEGDFLTTEKQKVGEDDFLGNVFTLNYYIDAKMLHYGKNVGAIVIYNHFDEIRIPVVVNRGGHARLEEENTKRKQTARLMHLYLDYRTGRISKHDWIKECHAIVNRMVSRDNNHIVTRLYQIQLLLTEKRYTEADKILERVGQLLEDEKVSPEIMGYYYYMKSLRSRDEVVLEDLAEQTEYLYVRNANNWRLAWLLMYMKEEYASNDQRRWDLIKKQYAYGNASPVLFLEALQAMNRMPVLMSELGDFELAFVTFAFRQNVLTREIRNRFVFLAGKAKTFSDELFYLLTRCYELDPKNETLQEICALLMKGNKMGADYFPWYAKAVEQEVRLTRLYEYYIMSIDLSYEGTLPKMILMYFAYRSNLDYERNAFLYSNILKHEAQYQDIFGEYYKNIVDFAKEQLLKGRINDNLAYIYQKLRNEILTDSQAVTAYLELLFIAEIILFESGIKYIIMINEHLKQELRYPIHQKRALVPVIGRECFVLLEDENGNRYADNTLFEYRLLMKKPADLEELMQQSELHLDIALYRAEESGDRVSVSKDNETILSWLSAEEDITEEYRMEIMIQLAEYYFENDLFIPLDELLIRLEPLKLTPVQRETCIRILVARGGYDKALEWVRTCGTEGVGGKTLLRLCDRILIHEDFEYEPELLKICEAIFKQGIYDETTLQYLLLFKEGSLAELKELWRAADSFEMEVHKLLENMMIQILYSGNYIEECESIYRAYIVQGSGSSVEKAFLSLLSFLYFTKENALDERIIDRVAYLQQTEGEPSIISRLAYLKKKAKKIKRKNLMDSEREMVATFIRQLWEKQIFLPLYLNFKECIPKLEVMNDHCFIEYHGKEGCRVILHYTMERDGQEEAEYHKEEMLHMYGGIYVKSFVLFYGERIRYYITQEDGRQEKLTESSVLQRDSMESGEKDNRFHLINHMIICQDMKDYTTYDKLAEEYVRKNYLVDRLFAPDLKID